MAKKHFKESLKWATFFEKNLQYYTMCSTIKPDRKGCNILKENNKMTLKQLLNTGKELNCELFGNFETRASLVWDDDISLTDEGYKHFQPIMDCPITCLSNGDIQVLVGDDLDDRLSEMVDDFVLSVAGYCPSSSYDKWFKISN